MLPSRPPIEDGEGDPEHQVVDLVGRSAIGLPCRATASGSGDMRDGVAPSPG